MLKPLLVLWFFKTFVGIVTFLFISVILNEAQVLGLIFVLFCNFGDIDTSSLVSLITSLVMFILLRSLGLKLTYISKRGVVRLSLVSISIPPNHFVVFFDQYIAI